MDDWQETVREVDTLRKEFNTYLQNYKDDNDPPPRPLSPSHSHPLGSWADVEEDAAHAAAYEKWRFRKWQEWGQAWMLKSLCPKTPCGWPETVPHYPGPPGRRDSERLILTAPAPGDNDAHIQVRDHRLSPAAQWVGYLLAPTYSGGFVGDDVISFTLRCVLPYPRPSDVRGIVLSASTSEMQAKVTWHGPNLGTGRRLEGKEPAPVPDAQQQAARLVREVCASWGQHGFLTNSAVFDAAKSADTQQLVVLVYDDERLHFFVLAFPDWPAAVASASHAVAAVLSDGDSVQPTYHVHVLDSLEDNPTTTAASLAADLLLSFVVRAGVCSDASKWNQSDMIASTGMMLAAIRTAARVVPIKVPKQSGMRGNRRNMCSFFAALYAWLYASSPRFRQGCKERGSVLGGRSTSPSETFTKLTQEAVTQLRDLARDRLVRHIFGEHEDRSDAATRSLLSKLLRPTLRSAWLAEPSQ